MIGFMDPSTLEDACGWPLRNLLYLLQKKYNTRTIKVLCYRQHQKNKMTSFVLQAELPETSSYDSKCYIIPLQYTYKYLPIQ
jgi:ubiquitin-like modifier-activating enzyme ATG7